ncbi:hypothetical protein IJD44_04775 [bacterium]|nr:hypothetical protein [bacterium]
MKYFLITGLIFILGLTLFKYKEKKNKNIINLVNKQGRTYTDFQPNGQGKIEIVYDNQLSILEAVNLSEEKINPLIPIKVKKIENEKIYIEKL